MREQIKQQIKGRKSNRTTIAFTILITVLAMTYISNRIYVHEIKKLNERVQFLEERNDMLILCSLDVIDCEFQN